MRSLPTALLLVLGLASATSLAAPTAQIKGGQSSIIPSAEVIDALGGCVLERVKPGTVKPDGDRLRFPVAGGALDLEGLVGEIDLKGGINLSCFEQAKVVSLQNFRVETVRNEVLVEPVDGSPEAETATVITALTGVDGNLTGRIDLFVPAGADLEVIVAGSRVQVRKANLMLTEEAATFLTEELGIATLVEGMVFGESFTRLNLRLDKETDSGEKSNNGKAKGKNKDPNDADADEEEDVGNGD